MNIVEFYELSRKGRPWGVGEGWSKLVFDLCKGIIEIDDTIEVTDCKEKWGGLRFYIGYGSDEIWELIETAEENSLKICEECGTEKDVTTESVGGWHRTLCGKCRKEAGG